MIPEPLGGAHRNVHDTVYNVEEYIIKTLVNLKRTKLDNLLENRYKKLRAIGKLSANNSRKKNQSNSNRIKAAVRAASKKSKPLPAKV